MGSSGEVPVGLCLSRGIIGGSQGRLLTDGGYWNGGMDMSEIAAPRQLSFAYAPLSPPEIIFTPGNLSFCPPSDNFILFCGISQFDCNNISAVDKLIQGV
jgi:hypothetical protein